MGRKYLTAGCVIVAMFLALPVASAFADDGGKPPAKCFVQNAQLQLPTCTESNGKWTVSYTGDSSFGLGGGEPSSPGIPGAFIALFVIVALLGIGGVVWKVSFARRTATDAGLDPDRAAAVTLMSRDGLDATYLASALKSQNEPGFPTPATTSPVARGAAERLQELQQLRDQKLITPQEYDARRAAIVGSV